MPQNLDAWLKYLETFSSGLTNPDLQRTRKVARKLAVLNLSQKIITVTGTNGKGSCVAFLEAILLAAGVKVGAYTSPHVLHYNERIRINGENISDEQLIEAFAVVEAVRGTASLSFFEFSTLAALWIFKNSSVDVLLLEVGVGGRMDPVNIIDPDIAVITTIALDHMQILGGDREAIALEKAGIMRAHKPVVCGDFNPPKNIYQSAEQQQAILYTLNHDYCYFENDANWLWESEECHLCDLVKPKLPLQNAATALMAIQLLQTDFTIPYDAINQGLQTATLLGRYQKVLLPNKVEIILDVAHNAEAAQLLASRLKVEVISGKVFAVMSMFQDKDIVATVLPLIALVDSWFVGKLHNSRAAEVDTLVSCLQAAGVSNVNKFVTITTALQQAIAESTEIDKILVFGSFHTVAEVLECLTAIY